MPIDISLISTIKTVNTWIIIGMFVLWPIAVKIRTWGSMRAHKWRVVLPLFKIIIIIMCLISRVTNYSLILAWNFSHVHPCHPFQQIMNSSNGYKMKTSRTKHASLVQHCFSDLQALHKWLQQSCMITALQALPKFQKMTE